MSLIIKNLANAASRNFNRQLSGVEIMSRIMTRAAFRAIELINEQIEQGVDFNGKPYAYSTKPFVMPYGRLPGGKSVRKALEKSGRIQSFKTKGGALWVRVPGGYADLRAMRGRSNTGDFLQDTGAMLADLQPIKTTDTEAVIGFRDRKQAEKAYYLNVSGAGKSRRLWRFLGLTAENRQKLATEAGVIIAEEFDKTGKLGV